MTSKLIDIGGSSLRTGANPKRQAFQFDGAVCAACELRAQCTWAKHGKGRSVSLRPQERLLQEARAFQETPAFQKTQRMARRASTVWPEWFNWVYVKRTVLDAPGHFSSF